MKSPIVSVYIPTKNRLDLLKRAVKSVLLQKNSTIELIIVDDYSTDGTKQYLNTLSNKNKNVRVFYNTCSKGACFSRNIAISNARGEFITGLDDDDYFTPDRISDFLEAWPKKKHDTIALCSLRKFVNQPFDLEKERSKCIHLINKNEIFIRNCIGNQVFTTTDLAKKISGFDPNLPAWQDLDFFLRLLSFGNIENTLTCTYVVDDRHSHNRISAQDFYKIKEAFTYVAKKHSVTKQNKHRLESQLLYYEFKLIFFIKCVVNNVFDKDYRALKATIMRTYRRILSNY